MQTPHRLILLLAGLALPLAAARADLFISSRSLALRIPAAEDAERVYAWYSSDGRRTWVRIPVEEACDAGEYRVPPTLRFNAPEDGRFDFYVMLVNAAGASAPPPAPGSLPLASVIVDTRPPLVQIHRSRPELGDTARTLALETSLIEENLADGGVRLFYRATGTAQWFDGGPPSAEKQVLRWSAPPDAPEQLDVRLMATDRAGNAAFGELLNVTLPQGDSPGRLAADAGPDVTNVESAQDPPAIPTTSAVLRPLPVAPVAPVTPVHAESPPDEQPAGPPLTEADEPPALSEADAQRVASLRRLASDFAARNELPLAAARLEEALALDPANAELLADYGRVLLRQRRFSAAEARFTGAVLRAPDDSAAHAGLAESLLRQNKFPAAQAHLLRLLELNPADPATLLQLGDTEHRLGLVESARKRWQAAQSAAIDPTLRKSAETRLKLLAPPRP